MTTPAAAHAPPSRAPASGSRLWLWVPSLYFSQGIPYVIVMTMSVVMYKRLGISNTDIALYTSWLYLPWVLKPLWSPVVDITKTKRFWIVSMQFLVALGLGLVAFSIRGAAFFRASLFLFWIMAFASATHDIAADGFYMLSLSKNEQAWWVGLRSTFYRAAMIVGSGLLVVLAGVLESKNGLPPLPIQVQAGGSANARQNGSPTPAGLARAPLTGLDAPVEIIARPASLGIPALPRPAAEASRIVESAARYNETNGFLQNTMVARRAPTKSAGEAGWFSRNVFQPLGALWTSVISAPLKRSLTSHFARAAAIPKTEAGNVAVVQLRLSRSPPPGRAVIVTLDRKKQGLEYIGLARADSDIRVVEGERLVFTSANWNKPAKAVLQIDPKLKAAKMATFVASSGNIPLAWSITLFVVAVLFLGFSCWHTAVLPRPANDAPVVTHKNLIREFFATLGSFFEKPGVLLAVSFILLYRFDEAQLVKVISPFLLDNREAGGMGLATSQVGLIYGTFGIAALTCGGLLGGFLAARYGLKRMLPIMVLSMYLPKLVFVFLSFYQPGNPLVVCAALALEQLGYGFGFTAFMLYMLYFADGPHKTAHYAICTGFMALGMMIPGMWSGWVADLIGYRHFFVWILFCALPGLTLAFLLKIDPGFGKKTAR